MVLYFLCGEKYLTLDPSNQFPPTAIYVSILHAKFQPPSFKTVGGDTGDRRTCDVTPLYHKPYTNS